MRRWSEPAVRPRVRPMARQIARQTGRQATLLLLSACAAGCMHVSPKDHPPAPWTPPPQATVPPPPPPAPPAATVDTAAVAQKLLQLDRDIAALADRVGAADAIYSHMAEHAVELSADDAPITGRASIRDSMRTAAPNRLKRTPKHAEVSSDGSLGWTWGEWRLVGPGDTPQATQVLSRGKYMDVWRRQADGSWKVIAEMGNAARKP